MDIEYLLWLQRIREAAGPVLEYVFYVITMLAIGGIVISFYIYYCNDKEKGLHAIVSFLIGNVFVQCLKNIFCINRPWIKDSRIKPSLIAKKGATGYSFPSGHSNAAASSYGSIAWSNRKRKKLCAFLIILILLAGFSRNYLGVHTPQDVIVGLACGTGAVFLSEWYFKWKQAHTFNEAGLAAGISIICLGLSIWTCLKRYPLVYVNGSLIVDPIKMQRDALQGYGMLTGFVIGNLMERKYVSFHTGNIDRKTKLERILISVVLVLIIYVLFHNVLIEVMDQRWCYYCMGVLMMFFASFCAPYVFVQVENHQRP